MGVPTHQGALDLLPEGVGYRFSVTGADRAFRKLIMISRATLSHHLLRLNLHGLVAPYLHIRMGG